MLRRGHHRLVGLLRGGDRVLIVLLILSVAGTGFCIWAEAHPPRSPQPVPVQTPTPVTVVIDDDDGDPPTVVQIKRG